MKNITKLIGTLCCLISVSLGGLVLHKHFSNTNTIHTASFPIKSSIGPSDTVQAYGIDISHHNAEPIWNELQVDFVIMKATEGTNYTDPTFAPRLKACKRAGIKVGAYHFFRGNICAKKEYQHFKKVISKQCDIIPVLDVEVKPGRMSKETFQNSILIFLRCFEKDYGCLPIIYTSEGFYNAYIKTVLTSFSTEPILWFGDIRLSWSDYHTKPHIHQDTIKQITGTLSPVDVNELHTSLQNILINN